MSTISFKADAGLKRQIETLAKRRGVNTSAYIKLLLTEMLAEELARVTENGLTMAEEMDILRSTAKDVTYGPFTRTKDLLAALEDDDA